MILLVLVAGFLWWSFSPLLFDKEVQEELDPELQARIKAQEQADARRQQNTNTASDNEVATGLEVDTSRVLNEGPYPIQGTSGHPASGEVEVIESPEEKLVYFTNYDGTNGPDLYVYLSKDLEATDYIDLGEAKGNQGNLIYGVPLDVDFSECKYVLTWCKAFGVLFDYAEIK